MSLVVINDYVLNRRIKFYLDHDDFEILDENWTDTDMLLVRLQMTETFNGRSRWCDLEPFHYRIMAVKNIIKVFEAVGVGSEIRMDSDSMKSLKFILCGMIRCLEKRADMHIELLRLVRVGHLDMAVEFEAALTMEITPPKKKVTKKGEFSIVVDNTDK